MIPEYRSFTHNLTDPITSLLEYYRNSEFPNQDELMLNSGGPVTDLSEYSFLPCIQSIRILFFEPMSELEEGKSSALDGEINLGKNNPLIILVQKFKNSGWETINQFEVETLEAAIEITESLELPFENTSDYPVVPGGFTGLLGYDLNRWSVGIKLDNKNLGNIDPNEIINFHSIKKGITNYLCILNSDGRFKKVLFDKDMIKSNRSFAITKLKNNIKMIDSFIANEGKNLIILTSIGRIFKFNLSDKFLTPTTKQSQGLMIAKLLPTEMIVSCCPYQNEEHIYLVSKQGKIICINANEIYYANEYSLGYLNERTQLKNDYFLKVLPSNQFLDIETNKNKSARLNFDKINFKSNKTNFLIDLLKLEKGEHLENCFRLENFIN